MNKSQSLIIGTIVSAMLGIPDINKIFTEEVIKIAMTNPSPITIFIVSLLKILLVIASVAWLIQLIKNIEFTYNKHSEDVFNRYILKLVLTALITVIIMLIAKHYFHI